MVLSEPLFYIYFYYGVSFLVMSYVIFRGIKKATAITLITTFYALVLFGLTHGITELIDWVRFILKIAGTGEIEILKYLSQICLIISFVILLQFGVNLLTYRNEKKGVFRLIPGILFVVYIVVLFIIKTDDISKAGLIARYSFGFSGALLSGIALYNLANSMKAVGDSNLIKGLVVIAIGFALYAVFGGLIIKPIFGLPIQLFRAVCAFTIAISSFYILDVFKASE
jgi:hypothetical protein